MPPRVAEEINLITLCLRTGTLPQAGGVLDQDPEWIRKIQAVREAEARRQEKDSKKGGR